jgi:hypothetical protein
MFAKFIFNLPLHPKKKKVWFSTERKAGNSELVRAALRASRLFEIA